MCSSRSSPCSAGPVRPGWSGVRSSRCANASSWRRRGQRRGSRAHAVPPVAAERRAPILVAFSLAVPQYITSEAALSFIGVGLTDETPSFGRMIYRSLDYLQTDPAYVFFPGITIFALVFAFNLFG
ncbi:hypothetical protein V2I01_07910 [Micromonospora sp. BRA006-A]|nr:hypothetical protein [Micromonospora sp. BRA006-A]